MSPNPLAAGAFGAHLAPSAWTDTLHTGVTYKKKYSSTDCGTKDILGERVQERADYYQAFLVSQKQANFSCCKDYLCTEQCVVQLMIIEVLIFSGVCASKQSPAFTST